MADETFDLATLLAPVKRDAFFQETWERQPLVISRGQPDYYAGLLTVADIDAIIHFSRHDLHAAATVRSERGGPRTAREGPHPDPAAAFNFRHAEAELSQLSLKYAQGHTVIVRRLQSRWPPLARLCRSLEMDLHHPVNANLYLTPPCAQGFNPHFDSQDEFILQVEGCKDWRLYESARELPYGDEWHRVFREQLGTPSLAVRLQQGDLLYIPRGHVHEASTGELASLHLTVDIEAYRWADLMYLALDHVNRQDAKFRKVVPPGYLDDGAHSAALKEHFQELLLLFARSAPFEEAISRMSAQFLDSLPALPNARLAGLEAVGRIDLDTVMEKHVGSLCRVTEEGESTVIEFPGNRVSGPRWIAPSLRFIAAASQFSVRSLPDNLSANSKVVLVQRLIREGLLRIV